ncbi:hypothetical protein NLM59_10145 [Weeksellaceae bacterium KMM 9724]|nr:hypothetical protein [Profundicola chukchiensis]MDG4951288.1 hypothetical protein [Profundicola chukchiensis]
MSSYYKHLIPTGFYIGFNKSEILTVVINPWSKETALNMFLRRIKIWL